MIKHHSEKNNIFYFWVVDGGETTARGNVPEAREGAQGLLDQHAQVMVCGPENSYSKSYAQLIIAHHQKFVQIQNDFF